MGFPVCDSCASSGILCEKCEWKVREGEVSELDVLLSTLLKWHKSEGYESIRDLDNKLVIFASESQASSIIGPKGKTAYDLSQKLGRRVVVLVDSWDKDKKIESLVKPTKVLAKNRIYRKDGKEMVKLIFDKPLDEATDSLVREIYGEVEIDYETTFNKGRSKHEVR